MTTTTTTWPVRWPSAAQTWDGRAPGHAIANVSGAPKSIPVELANTFTEARTPLHCACLLLVTMRDPVDDLFVALQARHAEWHGVGGKAVQCVSDAFAPGTVAAAVYAVSFERYMVAL